MSEPEIEQNNGHLEVQITSDPSGFKKESRVDPVVDYDDILVEIGEFGSFQLFIVILMGFTAMVEAGSVMYYSFAGNVPDHRCFVPACENESSTYEVNTPTWLNYTVPWEDGKPSSCQIYNKSLSWDPSICTGESEIPPVAIACQHYLYDKSLFKTTIVTKFDLVCHDSWKAASIESFYMAGMLIGAFSFGSISDKVGRKPTFLFLTIFMAVASIGGTFMPNYASFVASRLCAGAGGIGMFTVCLVLGLEVVGPKYRTATNFFFQSASTIGAILTGLVAYFVRDWQNLQLIISAPYAVFVIYWWLVPESVRWLISKHRNEEAKEIIQKIARANGKSVPQSVNFLDNCERHEKMDSKSESHQNLADNGFPAIPPDHPEEKMGNFWDVLKTPALLKRLLIMVFAWVVTVMCYYGLSIASTSLSGDYFLNYELSMIVELPSYLLGMWSFEKLGRKISLGGSLVLGGIACFLVAFVPDPPFLATTFSLIGKFFVSLAFGVIYGYTVELFPTASRGAALGICSTMSRLGSIAAPYIVLLDSTLPFLIFGACGLTSGVLSLTLPETLGKNLPENLQEAIDLEKNRPRLFPCCRKMPEPNENEVE